MHKAMWLVYNMKKNYVITRGSDSAKKNPIKVV